MLHYRVGEGGWQSWRRPPAALVVCFIPAREGEVELFQKYRQSWHTREREREGEGVQSRHSKRERGRAIRKEKQSAERGKESCLPKPCWLSQCAYPSVAQ